MINRNGSEKMDSLNNQFLDDKMPLDTFDKIEFVSPKEVEALLNWRDKNKDLVRNFNFVLEQGVIDSTHNGIKIIFQRQGNSVYLDWVMKRNGRFSHFLTFLWHYKIGKAQVIHPSTDVIGEANEFYDEQMQSGITIFASLMAYMEHYKENKELIKRNTKSNIKTKKKKNGKKKNIRKANKVIYNISFIQEKTENKREYTLDETKSWTVKGHWRHYKNGTKTFVKSYVKGNKDVESNPATYRL